MEGHVSMYVTSSTAQRVFVSNDTVSKGGRRTAIHGYLVLHSKSRTRIWQKKRVDAIIIITIGIITVNYMSSLLIHDATSRKVAGSIPDGVIEIFHRHNPSGRTVIPG
jgi:hypothetical protein